MAEVHAQGKKLIETLIGEQHLTESLVSAQPPPRFLDCCDVSRLGDRRAQTVWSTKLNDMLDVVDDDMLAWKVEVFADLRFNEDLAVVVKVLDALVNLVEIILSDVGSPDEVAEVKKGGERLRNPLIHVLCYSSKVHLDSIVSLQLQGSQ